MSTEIEQVVEEMERGLVPVTPKMRDVSPAYAEIMMLGNVLQKSGYFKDVRDQAQAVTKILFGRELGFSPIVSMSGIHIIEGKPALSSNLMATLIKRSGKYDYRVLISTAQTCSLMFKEKIDGVWEEAGESTFTIDDAKTAGVHFKSRDGHPTSWTKFPKAMLFARAISQGLRTYCPDVSAAPIYNPEEMGAEVNEEGDVTVLPKSARAVAVTTEDIKIEKQAARNPAAGVPTQEGASVAAGQDSRSAVKVSSGAESADASVESASTAPRRDVITPLPPVEELAAQAQASMSPKEGTVPAGSIDSGQAANFHREFKDALPQKLRKQAVGLAHDWLRLQKIVDSNGEPTAKAINKESYYDVREAAIEYAKTYNA